MPQKTYVSHTKPGLTVSRPGSKPDLSFVNGKLVLDKEEDQQFIESLPSFKDESITLEAPADLLADATKRAKELREVADKAESEAKAAEKIVADLTPKAEKAPGAPKPAKDPK